MRAVLGRGLRRERTAELFVDGIGCFLAGRRFDSVVVIRPADADERFESWLRLAVRCRVEPGGSLVVVDAVAA